jgi:hypothetical protein
MSSPKVVAPTALEFGQLMTTVAYDLSAIIYLGETPEKSPYLLYVHPLTSRVLPLRYAVAASAASHLASRFGNEALKDKSLELQLKAMVLMRQRLESSTLAGNFGTLLSILMMAQMDVCKLGVLRADRRLNSMC